MQNRGRSRSNSSGSERNNDPFIEPTKRLFISGLSQETNEAELRQLFEGSGKVVQFFFKKQENGGVLCFIEMETQEQADEAIANLNGKRICNKMMWVKYAKPRPPKDANKEGYQGKQSQSGFRPPRGDFNQRSQNGFKKYEGGRQNRNYEKGGYGGNGESRGRFNNGDRQNDRQGDSRTNDRQNNFRNSEKRDQGYKGSNGGNGGNSGYQGSEVTRTGRDQVASKPTIVEEHDY